MNWPGNFCLVAAVEGMSTLLTNEADTAAVIAAWAGTDWSSATSGLLVNLQQKQTANPWNAFANLGGSLKLSIADDSIGVLMHRTEGGGETELTESLDRNDTTVKVKSTTFFPSSGTIHIGTEAIAYSGKTSSPDTFTGCTRGKFSPFGCDPSGSGGSRFAHDHRVDAVNYSPTLAPRVTELPRAWIGRWVGLWLHERTLLGLTAKANARLLFAGHIGAIDDDPQTCNTVITVDHCLRSLAKQTIGRDMFSGKIADGVYIPAGVQFGMSDHNGTTPKNANPLIVVASGAATPDRMNQGFYSHSELFTKLNAWLAAERGAARLNGTKYVFSIKTTGNTADSQRTIIDWRIPGSNVVQFFFTLPKAISIFLGFNTSTQATNAVGVDLVKDSANAGQNSSRPGDAVPLRSWVSTGLGNIRLHVEDLSGLFQDQYATMPGGFQISLGPGVSPAGVFMFDDKILITARVVDNGDGTYDLTDVVPWNQEISQYGAASQEAFVAAGKRLDDDTPTTVRQVFLFDITRGDFINRLLYSTGTPGYNHGTLDNLPFGIGVGFPGGLAGTNWETSVQNIPGMDGPISPWIEKQIKITDLLNASLVLCHAFPVWKSGGLRMAVWQTPSSANATIALDESNKAEPAKEKVTQKSASTLTDLDLHNIIKVKFNRSTTSEDFASTVTVEDRTAIDDIGDLGDPVELSERNALQEMSLTGEALNDLIDTVFAPVVPLFSNAKREIRRSISPDLFEDPAPGDIAAVTDGFTRDPSTGLRRVTARPALIVGHEYMITIGAAGTELGHTGNVDIRFSRYNRTYAYSPSALVDSSANTGGFTAGYDSINKKLRCVAHKYSEASETADAQQFGAGDKIRIIEVDPSNSASPITWTREVQSIATNDIVLTVALSSPAFDATKTYRVIPDAYGTVVATQQDTAFQADDVNGLIVSTAQPNSYGSSVSTIAATQSTHADLPELHSDVTFGDGKPYDVGAVAGLAKLANNLIDHKTAIQSPCLGAAVNNTTYSSGGGWKLVKIRPIFLSNGLVNNTGARQFLIAPWLRSTDGTATSVRVTLCPSLPTDSTLNDIVLPFPASSATFSTSSTTWATGTPTQLSVALKNALNIVWVLIECNFKAETRDLAYAIEQERPP